MKIGHFLLPLPFVLLTLSVDWMMPIGASQGTELSITLVESVLVSFCFVLVSLE